MALTPARLTQMKAHVRGFATKTVTAVFLEEALREIERLQSVEKVYDEQYPCEGCNFNDGPEETCPRHGRPPEEVWQMLSDEVEAHRRTKSLISEVANTVAQERDEVVTERDTLKREHTKALQERDDARGEALDRLNRLNKLRTTIALTSQNLAETIEADDEWAARKRDEDDDLDSLDDPDDLVGDIEDLGF